MGCGDTGSEVVQRSLVRLYVQWYILSSVSGYIVPIVARTESFIKIYILLNTFTLSEAWINKAIFWIYFANLDYAKSHKLFAGKQKFRSARSFLFGIKNRSKTFLGFEDFFKLQSLKQNSVRKVGQIRFWTFFHEIQCKKFCVWCQPKWQVFRDQVFGLNPMKMGPLLVS